jgi:2-polyprenyl-3-methyl-5-hydroxy-6-metoxy-1,4-benzoquinol methylase
LRSCTRRFLALAPGAQARRLGARNTAAHWAQAALGAGYRRAPGAGDPAHYLQFDAAGLPRLMVFERIPDTAALRHPLAGLLAERDLHMDMSREFGPRADAHLARYALAAQWVRPGDVVLDCACGLGYGSAVIAARSSASRVIGVDIDPGCVDYARDQFTAQYGVEYHAAPGSELRFLPDASVDFIASFETIEHVADYEGLIDEFARVIKPDGRIVASVPNLWIDASGRDPNPHHFHAFDWDKFRAALARRFLVEARYRQEAPGGFRLHEARRSLARVPLDRAAPDTEWWIAVASSDPTTTRGAPYRHPQFAVSALSGSVIVDFAGHYRNPWLYRSLVQMGERLGDDELLADLAGQVIAGGDTASADFGAALTVMAYAVLKARRVDLVADLLAVAEDYVATPSLNPHVLRWRISLGFAAALTCLACGEREAAARWFARTSALDALEFSPLLATKTVAAWFWQGMLKLVDGDAEPARIAFASGVACARRALQAPDEDAVGNPARPLPFGFQELAEVADMAAQCAAALNHLELHARSPGAFWAKVDTRRFGLATWLLQLERENTALRAALAGNPQRSTAEPSGLWPSGGRPVGPPPGPSDGPPGRRTGRAVAPGGVVAAPEVQEASNTS